MKISIRRSSIIMSALIVVLLLMSFVSGVGAQGQGDTGAPGVWSSAINLQNVGTGDATIVINFFDSDGNEISGAQYTTDPLAAGGSLSIYVPSLVTGLPPGQYSAVVSSDEPVLASVNTSSTASNVAPWTGFAYDGFDSSQTGETLYFPGNYNSYYGFFSELVVQNASATTTANLTARFLRADGTQVLSKSLGALNPNAAKTYTMSSLGTPSGNTNGLFGAVITSAENVPLVGVANIWKESGFNGTASYSGFTGGASTLYPPALYNNYYSFNSALTIQNVSDTTAVGTITYSNGVADSFNLVPGAAKEFYQPSKSGLPSGNTNGVFGAQVETSSGAVVGLVSLSASNNGSFASYNAPSEAAPTVNISNVNSDYYGYFSAVTVQNTGTGPTDVTINYADCPSRTFTNVAGGAAVNVIQLNNAGDTCANRVATSAEVSSSNGNNLVAVVQHNTASNVAGYDPAKNPSDFLMAVTGMPK